MAEAHAHAADQILVKSDDRDFDGASLEAAQSMHDQGNIYFGEGRVAEAEQLYEQSLEIRLKFLGEEHEDVGRSLANLGLVRSSQGRYWDATHYFSRALTILKKALGEESELVGSLQTQEGFAALNAGHYKTAESSFKLALPTLETIHGKESEQAGSLLYNIGFAILNQHDYERAEAHLKRALPILERSHGKESEQVGSLLHHIGFVSLNQGHYEEAEAHLKRALPILETIHGKESEQVGSLLHRIGFVSLNQGHYEEAEAPLKRALPILETIHGKESEQVGSLLYNIGLVAFNQGNHEEAEALIKRALPILEAKHGKLSRETGRTLDLLRRLDVDPEHYSKVQPPTESTVSSPIPLAGESAEGLDCLPRNLSPSKSESDFKALLDGARLCFGGDPAKKQETRIRQAPRSPASADIQTEIGDAFRKGYGTAIDLKAAAAWYLLAARQGHSVAFIRVAQMLDSGVEFPDAKESPEFWLQRAQDAIEIIEWWVQKGDWRASEALGWAYSRGIVFPLDSKLAEQLYLKSQLQELEFFANKETLIGSKAHGETLFRYLLEIQISRLGLMHPDVARTFLDLGSIASDKWLEAEAETHFRNALEIYENTLGPEHSSVASPAIRLGHIYEGRGQYPEALALYTRALAIYRQSSVPDQNRNIAAALSNIAGLHLAEGRLEIAETLYKEALFEHQKTNYYPTAANILKNLGKVYLRTGRASEAVEALERAVGLHKDECGSQDCWYGSGVRNTLASALLMENRLHEAEALFRLSLESDSRSHGSESIRLVPSLHALASFLLKTSRAKEALIHTSRVKEIVEAHLELQNGVFSEARDRLPERHEYYLVYYLELLELIKKVAAETQEEFPPRLNESFGVAQWIHNTKAAHSLDLMNARVSANDPSLEKIIRERQILVQQWRELDLKLASAIPEGKGTGQRPREAGAADQLQELLLRITSVDEKIATEFPVYQKLANPRPLSIEETQSLIAHDEAIIFSSIANDQIFLWLIRKDMEMMFAVEFSRETLAAAVTEIRSALDSKGVKGPSDVPEFPIKRANALYEKIFARTEIHLRDVNHLLFVPDGALESLPLGVLVTDMQDTARCDATICSGFDWLADRHAISVLPSISSLSALRKNLILESSSEPFAGFGDPLLADHPSQTSKLVASSFFRRGSLLADPARIRQLVSLPETSAELETLARSLEANPENLFLRERATERIVKQTDLSNVRIIAFATHALVVGDFEKLGEPALVLTPPRDATVMDDGLLTASEISGLQLNADLVILSACNTAAPDGRAGAQGLSGLASSFFYAGARALVVSHWEVFSGPAADLTTRMIRETRDPQVGLAEALKRSMKALRSTPGKPYYAHPMFWAPFVVVGEGAGQSEGLPEPDYVLAAVLVGLVLVIAGFLISIQNSGRR